MSLSYDVKYNADRWLIATHRRVSLSNQLFVNAPNNGPWTAQLIPQASINNTPRGEVRRTQLVGDHVDYSASEMRRITVNISHILRFICSPGQTLTAVVTVILYSSLFTVQVEINKVYIYRKEKELEEKLNTRTDSINIMWRTCNKFLISVSY